MAKKFTIKKYDGDHAESFAVFYSAHVKGIKGNGPVFYGDATPARGYDSMGRAEATRVCDRLNTEAAR